MTHGETRNDLVSAIVPYEAADQSLPNAMDTSKPELTNLRVAEALFELVLAFGRVFFNGVEFVSGGGDLLEQRRVGRRRGFGFGQQRRYLVALFRQFRMEAVVFRCL